MSFYSLFYQFVFLFFTVSEYFSVLQTGDDDLLLLPYYLYRFAHVCVV